MIAVKIFFKILDDIDILLYLYLHSLLRNVYCVMFLQVHFSVILIEYWTAKARRHGCVSGKVSVQ